jgi:hypothetical protein
MEPSQRGGPTRLILVQETHEMEINLLTAQGRPAQRDQKERNLEQEARAVKEI